MRDLSLHVLDLAQNSVSAGASRVEIFLTLETNGWLTLVIRDDGRGMSPELLARVTSPFATTRTTRRVGLGIPLMQENAEKTGGSLQIQSEVGKGTELTVTLDSRSIDCLPLGDLPGTMLSLILMHPDTPDFHFHGVSTTGVCDVDTREIRQAAGGLPLNEPAVAVWLKTALAEEINPIFGGANV